VHETPRRLGGVSGGGALTCLLETLLPVRPPSLEWSNQADRQTIVRLILREVADYGDAMIGEAIRQFVALT
jgi:hypothetical protein